MWLRKKTQNLPTSWASCRFNHRADGVYGLYERPLRAPTEESALVLTAVGSGGKDTQEWDQMRL